MQEFEKILKIIRARKHEIGEAMIYGNVKDMEHYKELVGNVKALQMVEDELMLILEKSERDDK